MIRSTLIDRFWPRARQTDQHSDREFKCQANLAYSSIPPSARWTKSSRPQTCARLPELVNVIWGKSEPMPHDDAVEALAGADAVICSSWRYGDILHTTPKLRRHPGRFSGGFPSDLDYDYCFRNGIRVLSAAPAFGRQVAEMALGMAIACARAVVDGHQAMQRSGEDYLHAGNVGTFTLYHKTGRLDRLRRAGPLSASTAQTVWLPRCRLRCLAGGTLPAPPGRHAASS